MTTDPTTRADEQRRRVVDAAAQIFSRQGYRATSMIELAAEVGLAKPTLYHYFTNKEQLLVRIYEEVLDESLQSALQIVAAAPTPLDALRSLIVDRVRYTCEHRQLLKVCFEEEEELPPDLSEAILERRRAYEDVYMTTLAEHLATTGALLPMSARVWVNATLGAANWVYKWYSPTGTETPLALGEHIAELVLGPLTRRTHPSI